MSVIHAIILGIVQGLGEFLPISSSAHLVLVPWLLGWQEHTLAFDVALHMGTLVAVTIYFWRDLLDLLRAGLTEGTKTPMGKMAWGIVLGSIPGGIVGLALENWIEHTIRGKVLWIALPLAVMGIVLWLVDKRAPRGRSLADIRVMDVVWMGVGQAFAIIPGFSRSGSTMLTGRLVGLDRTASAKASFLLGWPLILAAGVLALKDIPASAMDLAFWLGIAASAVTGYAVIAFLMEYLRKGTFAIFAIYRLAITALVVLVYLIR
ncbi:MAG TPA: undecaprenyl-diphosphate phosphatase [Symbiobacteriaceae bacterium]|nr:undecaprenyl-diphosphate phosphatase [Symbiobacteriaceae bacterium]